MNVKLVVTLLTCCLLTSCAPKEDVPESPWPVWILYVHAQDALTRAPVESCARVVWRFSDSSESNTTTCQDTYPDRPDFVKVWRPIREPLTVIYQVECDGYIDTGDMSAYFDPELAYTRPGAPGDEDIEDVTVNMYPE
jgi:hypothetical protein